MKKITTLTPNNALLVGVDFQEKLLPAMFEKDKLLLNSFILFKSLNILNVPIIGTEQYPQGLGGTVNELNTYINKKFEKTSFSPMENQNFQKIAKAYYQTKRRNVIIAGVETHICVYQTALAFYNMGFTVHLVENCSSSRDINNKLYAIEDLNKLGIRIRSSEGVIFELLKDSKNEVYREIAPLIK